MSGSSEFNVRPDPPRITSRRFIKTVKQKKRFRSSVSVCWVFAVKAMGENGKRMGERRAGERQADAGVQRGYASVPDVSDHGAFSWSSSPGSRWISSRFLTRGDAPGQLKRR